MLRVLPPMFQPVLQQIKLLQKVESSFTFCNKILHVLPAQGKLVLQQMT